jgi:hypothetical protein
MAKIKTRTWLEALAQRAGESEDMRREYEQNVREQTVPEEGSLEHVDAEPDAAADKARMGGFP